MTDFTLKFMDWTPVPPEYMEKLAPLISAAARSQELMTPEELDELEKTIPRS
jgi:hypothetical protein